MAGGRVPRVKLECNLSSENKVLPESAARPRVLIADDHSSIVGALRVLLTPSCEIVATVTDCHAVVEATTRLQPDIVLLDLNLPHGTSLLACREITKTAPRTRVIMLTGGADAADRPHVLAAGAIAFIDKFSIADELLPEIAQALGQSTSDW
jgi:DNA-binding NarL/FixJ family response regulator